MLNCLIILTNWFWMNAMSNVVRALILTISMVLSACSNNATDASLADKKNADKSLKADEITDNSIDGTTTFSKDEQTKIYHQAILEYLKVVYQRHGTSFDTLFFGKHEEFPDIKLDTTIQGTRIMLVTTDEADKRREYRKSLVYINLFGDITKESAHFIFVTFFPEYHHQYDYFIDLAYHAERNEFELERIQFKNNFSRNGEGTVSIYENGKYVDDASVKDFNN